MKVLNRVVKQKCMSREIVSSDSANFSEAMFKRGGIPRRMRLLTKRRRRKKTTAWADRPRSLTNQMLSAVGAIG
jgi:hypothetical protein